MSAAKNKLKAAPFDLYWRSLHEVRPWWGALGGVLALGMLWTPIALLLPLPVKIILDSVIGTEPLPPWIVWLVVPGFDGNDDALVLALALTVAIAILVLAHNTADWLLREGLAERVVREMRMRMINRTLEVSALNAGRGSQDYGYRIVHDAPAIQWATIYGFGPIINALFSLVVLMIVTSRLSMTVAFLALATSVPMILLIHRSQRRICDGWLRVKDIDSKAITGVQEALAAWRVVISCGQERRVVDKFSDLARGAFGERLNVMGLQAALGGMMSLGTALGTAAILFVSVRDVQAGLLTAGELILIIGYVGQLYGPIHVIGTHTSNQQAALASMERSFELMDQRPPIEEAADPLPLIAARGSFELRDVSFAYGGERPILSRCSITIPPGSWVGICGATGAGKTTLVNLLVRLIDPVEGAILLDGHDLRRYRLSDLRRQFAILGQECLLVTGTIEENIAYARPGASRDEVIRAAKLAEAHDFIAALRDGYHTAVGEGGLRLSGGERQRVALARAYLKDAPILVLDEPTGALDAGTERSVIAGLKQNMVGRTVFMITHRPSVLAQADLVLRVEGAHVAVEAGHLELPRTSRDLPAA
jgi:ATP-binding cassette, subfamily B, bacterial